jgi:hypothetical protein
MIDDGWGSSDIGGHELVEGAFDGGPRVIPEAVAPVSQLRSPIMEHRRVDPLPSHDDGARELLPVLRTMVGPFELAALVAAPVLLLAGWQVAVVVGLGVATYRVLDRLIDRVSFSLGDGFLPYRSETGWPQGVQEDDDVHWNWSATRRGQPVRG